MSRLTIVSLSAIKLRLFSVCLYIACLSGVAYANDGVQQVQESNDFEILYHELLDFQFQSANDEDLGSSAKQEDHGYDEMLSFDAYAKRFELLLKSNDRLIANLPETQQQTLKNAMRLYRGEVSGMTDSWVRITVEGNRISGMIWDGTEMFVIDNAADVSKALGLNEDTLPSYPLIYRLSDTASGQSHCALDPSERPLNDYSGLVKELDDAALAQATSQLDVAVVADAQFTQANANPNAAVVARMNVVDGIFSEQVGVQLNVVEIRPLQNNNSLSSTSAGTLLRQFESFVGAAGFNNPGLTHLFTGRDMDGSTIGIAFLGTLCNARRGIGISQTRGNGTAGALTVAHELGHNFGAPHDNQSGSACASSPSNFLMNPTLNGSDQFSQCSVSRMQPNVRNAACIASINPPVAPTPVPPGPTQEADIRVGFPVNPINARIEQPFNYQIEVRNSGAARAVNAFSDILVPNGLSVESAQVRDGNCINRFPGEVNCDLNGINAGAVKTLSIELRATQAGRFISEVNVGADNDANPRNDRGEVVINVRGVSTSLS